VLLSTGLSACSSLDWTDLLSSILFSGVIDREYLVSWWTGALLRGNVWHHSPSSYKI
jgi:hypothetical protein